MDHFGCLAFTSFYSELVGIVPGLPEQIHKLFMVMRASKIVNFSGFPDLRPRKNKFIKYIKLPFISRESINKRCLDWDGTRVLLQPPWPGRQSIIHTFQGRSFVTSKQYRGSVWLGGHW
jgi:hypothetical protein